MVCVVYLTRATPARWYNLELSVGRFLGQWSVVSDGFSCFLLTLRVCKVPKGLLSYCEKIFLNPDIHRIELASAKRDIHH